MTTENATTVHEEVEAALLEGMTPISEELAALREKYNKLNAQIAELEAEKQTIKITVGLMADMEGVSMFTENGVKVLGYNTREVVTVDKEALVKHWPEAAKEVITTKQSHTFYCKK